MEADFRTNYIVNIVAAVFGTNQFDQAVASSPKVAEFLNDLNCTSLQCLTNGAKVKFFINTFGIIEDGYQDVHFIKRGYQEITGDSIANQLLVSTMRQSPLDSLYQYMKSVYEPLLVNESDVKGVSPQMKNLVSSLKSGLATTLRQGSTLHTAADEDHLEGILSPVDEIEFWSDIEKMNVQTSNDEKLRQKAEALNKHFSKISKSIYDIDSMELVKVNDLIDALYDTMDFIWTDEEVHPPYGEERMKHFIKISTSSIGAKIEKELNAIDVWTSSFSDVRMKLNECMKICKSWREKIADLTGSLWKAESNKWTGGTYYDPYLERLITRLNEIFEIRSQHDELMRLLSPEDQSRLNVESAFQPFREINCFYHNEYQTGLWNRAKDKYQDNLEPMENELCDRLRKEIFAEKCEPTQRLREFQRWKGLLSIERIKSELKSERSSLLTELISYIGKIAEDFDSKSGSSGINKPPLVNNMSRIVNDIVWARQLSSSKVISTQKVAENLFQDLDSIDEFRNACRDLASDIKDYEKKQFNKWMGEIENLMNDKNESLQLTGRLMEIDINSGVLKVKYSEKKLVTLLKDIRQLSELGFKIPKQLIQITESARKFYKEGVTLRQVANFFNNMSTQIMDCHSTMLLRHTIHFEKIIKGKAKDKNDAFGKSASDVTWSSPVELEEYIHEVQSASNDLMRENRRLRKMHTDIVENIVAMMSIDLLKNKNIWKEKLDTIKRILDSRKYSAKETRIWRTHLDYQLYKALEHQYQMGLESLNENFNIIEADLVYVDKTVSFRPPIEILKSKYYKEISNFIDIPIKFTGLGGKPSIYKIIPSKNAQSLMSVYAKAEELFNRLDNMIKTFMPWTALGYFDLETYIEENFTDVKDWENNYKMLRVKRKQLEKLNEYYKIDNFFNIRTEPFKKGIEDLFQKMNDVLKYTLKARIKIDMEEIDKFIDEGMKKLNARPQSVEEIGQAKAEAVQIASKKDSFVNLYNQCEERNRVLKQISGEGAQIGDMQNRWENFDVALNAFSSMIDEQKNVLKKETDKRIQALNVELEKTFNRWEALKPKERSDMDRETAMETSEKMKEWREKWDELETKIKNITADCEHFGIEMPEFQYYQELKNDLAKQEESWRFYDEFYTELAELGKEDWLSFSRGKGIYQFQDFNDKWSEKVKAREPDQVKRLLNQAIDNFREAWPLFKICVGEAFEKEHWRALFYMLEFPKEVNVENLKFGNFIDAIENMVAKSSEIKDLGARAQGEVSLREAIQELRAWCDQTEFALTEYVGANNRTVPLIKDWKELMNQVSDNQSLLISLKESRFFSRFSDQVEQFESKLTGIDDYLQKLNVIQRKWVYLEPIFIRGALPSEQARFNRVDGEYVSIMMGIGTNPKVVSLCDIQGLKETLDTILSQLDVCQKALNDFLEEKRSKFPRFYFIGDDDLLEILGQATNPTVIQTHLKKLFAGIFRVDFDKNNSSIVAMKSSAGEYVELSAPVRITEDVENWLGDLVNEMRQTLSTLLKNSLGAPSLDIMNTPSQICCLSEMIHFGNNCISAIKKGKLSNYKIDLQKTLEMYTSFDHGGDMLLLSKLKALILDIIHNIEVVDALITNGVKNISQWEWYKQLKYSIDPRKDVCNVGNAPKLVHTPLTDKCFLTLTQGMKMGYGGNPYGPAGTGKTESVKALGQAFGRQVLVFNCDEGIDFKSMGRIFIGLVKCGAWGCFDEFNRLLEEQLSAISQQIQVIQWAIKQNEPSLELLNRTIEVNKNAGIFVTMNPAGKGYGGRSKLPDNLKQLFRPVAMSAPDNELIAEVYLFSEGFKHSKQLAQKLIPLFTLSKQLLSPQQHYDWGLRALKAILTVGGQLVQRERTQNKELSFNLEALILIKAIRINTMSKLTFGDSKKFEFLLSDMFPGIKVEDIVYEDLEKAIHETLQELNLESNSKQLSKMLQFHEATNQRMGVVIVGPSGCGKSTIWKVLRKSYEKLGINMSVHVMNPKSMSRHQLLGEMDHDTREFKDGVLTESARRVVKEPFETKCWIICDGDIDPKWIESLNSVLDDNHLLTLPNGERISFGDNVNFIFESDNLKFASPATVSRMGMIFLSEEDVNVSRLIHTWIKQQNKEMQGKLESWMDEIFYKALDWVLKNDDKWIIETTKVGIVQNVLCSLYNIDTKAAFVDGVIRGLGGNLSIAHRSEVTGIVFQLANERPADPTNLLNNYYNPRTSSFEQFLFDYKDQKFTLDDMKNLNKPPIVETISAQRDANMIEGWFRNDKPFILVGPEGCGKSLIISSIIKKVKSTSVATIHCNAQTSSYHIIQKLNQMCVQSSKSQGKVYRPKEGQKLVLYLKDINLPKPDEYDTIELIAFLHQIVCYQGFYDENLEFVYLERIHIIASMTPATVVGRHKLSCRFTANVCIAYIEDPTSEELENIYALYLKNILSHENFGSGAMGNSSKKIARFCVDTYENIKQKFSVDDHRHYLLTPKELTKWIFGIMRYEAAGAEALVEILTYEAFRLFRDRLVNIESRQSLDQLVYNQLRTNLKYGNTIGSIYFLSKVSNVTPIFAGYKTLGRLEKDDLEATIKETIKSYEREFKELNIILVDELLEKFAQLERSLSQNGGHVLLAGRSGTEAGIENRSIVLYVEDHQMCETEFYEYLNSLISSGEIPGLYAPEEIDPLLNNLQDELRNEYECRNVYELFVTRINRNLRIVLSLDCKHPDFMSNCSSNPALTTKCNVIWSDSWSKGSMSKVSDVQLAEAIHNLEIPADELNSLLMQIHISSIDSGATPLHFFQFIDNYKLILGSKISSQDGQSRHLIAGLDKLREAAETVDKLSQKAQNQKVLLKEKQSEADAALDKINIALEKKADRKQEAEKLRSKCLEDEEVIKERKVLIEDELVDIMPEVEAAREKVGELKTDNLNEIKAFRIPPDPVHDVLGAVLFLMGVKDTTWGNMKKFLSQRGVIQNILGFDAHYITKDIRDSVNKMINKKKNSFEDKTIRAASVATAPLAAWVKAQVKYSEVLLKIEPLEREMNSLLADLQTSQSRVDECTKQLQQLEDSTKILNNELKAKTNEAAELKIGLEKAEQILNSAQNLLLQLSGEKDRWEIQVEEIRNNIKLLPYKSLLSAAYIVYTGQDDEKIRESKLNEWKQMLRDDGFNFTKFMVTESQLLKWKTEGLPADELSMENAIMIRNTQKTPMIFDPATQATEWLKSTLKNEANSSVEFLNQNDPKYNTKLEISIRFGKVCIIEEVDGVDKMLFPVLRKDLIHQGPRWVVQCGDKTVDYNDSFRLFFSTRDSNLDIPPNASPLVIIVNFTVTKSGLESQLLSITINFEEPELEKKKTEILQEEENFKIKLAEYQKNILDELANSEGNLLDNKQLVDSLNNTKAQSIEIEKALKDSQKFQQSLDTQRSVYRSFSAVGANLFMVIEDLVKINNMYQFSLASFIEMFKRALESKPTASSTDEKLKLLTDTLIKLVFFEIGRSLFKDDRLTYGLHFVHGIFSKLFLENEWEFFTGTVVAPSETSASFPRWATPDRKAMFNSFASLFPKVCRACQFDNQDLWLPFVSSIECEKEFPTSVSTQLSAFQKLLVIKTFRPDRLESSMNEFVCQALRKKTVAPAPLSLKTLYENDTDCFTPILFITSPGSDPSDELQEFAAMEIGRQGYHELAMGGGENQIAIEMMKDAAEKGEWVFLKNLHLVTPWLPTLEKEFKMLNPDKKFRLWMTSEPHPKFPSILLKTSLTITYESPPGIKNSLQRTYQSWAPTFEEGNLLKSQILFILAWFNSLIQERRKYIPQGWSKYYEFSYGDLKAGETILGEIIDMSQGQLPQWEIVHGLLENAIYGGRIDNEFDMRVLKTYLKQFFNSDVFQGSKKLSSMIQVPKAASIRDYIQYISTLPDQDSPLMFGLPTNIDRSVQRFNSQKYINILKAITAVSKEDLKFDREMWAKLLGPILKLWKSIYKPDGFRSLKIKPGHLNSEDPVEAFTYMEAANMLSTLQKINETLSSIARVIKGTGMLTSKIENEATALLKREVPEAWHSFWDGPDNPQDWLIKFERKASALLTWVDRTQSGDLLNTHLSLSDLYHPETFFNALRQKSGRALKCPIDELKLVSTFESKSMGGKISISIDGMYLQGAGFDRGKIVNQSSEDLIELLPLPPCNLAWVKTSDPDPYSEGTTVNVPVYFSILRETLLCELKVPNAGNADDRIISGVAIFLDGSD